MLDYLTRGRSGVARGRRLAAVLGCGLALFAAAVSPRIAVSQTPPGEVRIRLETVSGAPLAGALVALIDENGNPVAEGLSGLGGARAFRVPRGTYRVRVRRIGFEPYISAPLSVPSGELVFRIETRPVLLSTVQVTASSRCHRPSADGQALARVWEEISKALRASQLTIEDLSGIGRAFVFRREAGATGEVTRNDTTVFLITDARPFGAIEPGVLADAGYVQGEPWRGWTYYGPDETVLLSDEFLSTHCFRIVRSRDRRGQVGVAFEPVPRRRTPDIAGTIWVEEASAELREVTFRHVNAGLLSRFDAGGLTRFQRMPSGAWIVTEWQLRAPRLEVRPGADDHITTSGYVEDGGGILTEALVRLDSVRKITVSGIVYDSIGHRALPEAAVVLGNHVTRTDTAGNFRLAEVWTAARYLSFVHPSFSRLGVVGFEQELPYGVDSLEMTLATPSFRTAWFRICNDTAPETPVARNLPGIIHGRVADSQGNPVGGAQVTMRWSQASSLGAGVAFAVYPQELVVITDAAGRYAACGFSPRSRGAAFVSVAALRTEPKPFTFDESPIIWREFIMESPELTATPSPGSPEPSRLNHE